MTEWGVAIKKWEKRRGSNKSLHSEAKKLKIPVFKSHSSSADSLKNAIKILEDSLEGKKV